MLKGSKNVQCEIELNRSELNSEMELNKPSFCLDRGLAIGWMAIYVFLC